LPVTLKLQGGMEQPVARKPVGQEDWRERRGFWPQSKNSSRALRSATVTD